jgi:hypothetical protein
VCGSISGGGLGEVIIQDNQVRITIGIAQIGQTSGFKWRCGTFQVINDIFVPGNTETNIAVADLFSFSVPAIFNTCFLKEFREVFAYSIILCVLLVTVIVGTLYCPKPRIPLIGIKY